MLFNKAINKNRPYNSNDPMSKTHIRLKEVSREGRSLDPESPNNSDEELIVGSLSL